MILTIILILLVFGVLLPQIPMDATVRTIIVVLLIILLFGWLMGGVNVTRWRF